MQFFDQLSDLFRARYPLVMLTTHEHAKIYRFLKSFCREAEYNLFRWNCVEGMLELGLSFDTEIASSDAVSDPAQVLTEIQRRVDSREPEIFVLEGISDFLHYASVKVLLRKLATDLPKSVGPKHVILLSQTGALPQELVRFMPVLEVPLPSEEELGQLLDKVAEHVGATLPAEARAVIVEAAIGLTGREANLAFQLVRTQTQFGIGSAELVRETKGWIVTGTVE